MEHLPCWFDWNRTGFREQHDHWRGWLATRETVRETKNTYRYDAADDDAPVGNIYIQKKAMPGGAPPELELQLTAKTPDAA